MCRAIARINGCGLNRSPIAANGRSYKGCNKKPPGQRRFFIGNRAQKAKCSASSSIRLSAPLWIAAAWAAVRGTMRS